MVVVFDEESYQNNSSDNDEENIVVKKKKKINKSFDDDFDQNEIDLDEKKNRGEESTSDKMTKLKKFEDDTNEDSGIDENRDKDKINNMDLENSCPSDDENSISYTKSLKKKKYCFDDDSDNSSDDENLSILKNKSCNSPKTKKYSSKLNSDSDDSDNANTSDSSKINRSPKKTTNKKYSNNFNSDSDISGEENSLDSLETNKSRKSTKKKEHGVDLDSDLNNSDQVKSPERRKSSESRRETNKKDKRAALEELVQRKKYKTRGEEKLEEFEMNSTENLFKDKDLFCADDSNSSSDEDQTTNIVEKKKIRKNKVKEERIKKPTKASIKETKSEQQRLCRERSVQIPYHEPATLSIKSFLDRIPKIKPKTKQLKVNEQSKAEDIQEITPAKPFEKIFKEKPRLSLQTVEFNDDEEKLSEPEVQEVKKTKSKVLDSFMERFAKHTVPTRHAEVKEEKSIATQNPGLAHQILKNQLKQQINEERRKSAIEEGKQAKLYDKEEISDDEKFFDEDEGDDGDVESSDSNDDENEEGENKNEDDDDEEISKWNADDERRQIEVQLEEDMDIGEKEQSDEPNTQITDSVTTSLPVSTHLPVTSETQWSNSSSVLPAGQGNACNPCSVVVGSTPFTKLLKSGLLDSTSKSNLDAQPREVTNIEMPIEDTQDLYRDEGEAEKVLEKKSESLEHFQFNVDEDTQFVPLLDSQGNFQDQKEPRKSIAESLFDAKSQEEKSEGSLTQALGFCSGSFADTAKEISKEKEDEDKKVTRLDNILDTQNEVDDVMNLCSGNFSDFKTQKQNEDTIEGLVEADPVDGTKESSENQITDIDFVKESDENADFIGKNVDESSINENNEIHKNDDESDEEDGGESDSGNNDAGEDDEDDNLPLEEEESNQNVPEELQEWTEFLSGNKKVKKLNKRAFYENEAELSGSDVNSDDEEYGSEYDEYEVDSDVEEGLPDSEKLRRQVHKIHQRKLLDQDKREVRILQELYLEDGELGVGAARKRNFRWRNIDDDNGAGDENKQLSDEENDESAITMSIDRRLERIEKEKFLQESQSTENILELDDNSQHILNRIQPDSKPAKGGKLKSRGKNQPFKRSGSLLGKASILSAQEAGGIKQANVQKSGRGFVFQAAEDMRTPKAGKKTSSADSKSTSCQPARKKQRVEERKKSLPSSSSIFNLL